MQLRLVRKASIPAAVIAVLIAGGSLAAAQSPAAASDGSTSSVSPSPDDSPSDASTPTPSPQPSAPASTPKPAHPKPTASVAPPAAAKPAKHKKPKKPKKPKPQGPQATSWAAQGIDKIGIKGIDVSGWQHPDGAVIDWTAVKAAGIKWAYTKCSDGAGTGDFTQWGPIDVTQAQAAGIHAGCYHYAQPGRTNLDVVTDAKNQAAMALAASPALLQAHLPIALDLEETGTLNDNQLATWAVTFLTEVQAHSTRVPWLYASSSFLVDHLMNVKALKRFPVWVAAYGEDYKLPPPLPTWALTVAWQFSSAGVVPGVPTNTTDLDVFLLPRKVLYPQQRPVPAATPAPAPAPSVAPKPVPMISESPLDDSLPHPVPSPQLSPTPAA